jgi:hypothetical protein
LSDAVENFRREILSALAWGDYRERLGTLSPDDEAAIRRAYLAGWGVVDDREEAPVDAPIEQPTANARLLERLRALMSKPVPSAKGA